MEARDAELEASIAHIGRELHGAHPRAGRHPLRALDRRAMEMTSRDQELRAALFRLVDVTPACRSLDDLARHLNEYVAEAGAEPPPALAAAMRATGSRAGRGALGAAVAGGVRHMAHRFIVGESPAAALPVLHDLWKDGVASSVDLLGEATVTEVEADRYAERCREALDALATAMAEWPERPELEWAGGARRGSGGASPRLASVNLSVKVSALTPLMHPQAPEVGRDDAARRMRPLLRSARELGAHLHIDMESLDSLETTMELVFELLAEDEFRDGPSAGVVLQAYLRESAAQLDRLLGWAAASRRTVPLTVRLVKGAYWDHEIVEARRHGWSPPVFEVKADCDRNFEALTRRLLDARAGGSIRVAVASHNLRSVAHAIAYDRATGADGDLELQVLRGLGDDLAVALSESGLRVRSYCPVGDLVAGMAYLVRRLLENTSNESFLGEQHRGAPLEELLAAP